MCNSVRIIAGLVEDLFPVNKQRIYTKNTEAFLKWTYFAVRKQRTTCISLLNFFGSNQLTAAINGSRQCFHPTDSLCTCLPGLQFGHTGRETGMWMVHWGVSPSVMPSFCHPTNGKIIGCLEQFFPWPPVLQISTRPATFTSSGVKSCMANWTGFIELVPHMCAVYKLHFVPYISLEVAITWSVSLLHA